MGSGQPRRARLPERPPGPRRCPEALPPVRAAVPSRSACAEVPSAFWTDGARLDPGADQLAEELLRAQRRLPPCAGIPAPPDERVLGIVLDDLLQVPAAIAV